MRIVLLLVFMSCFNVFALNPLIGYGGSVGKLLIVDPSNLMSDTTSNYNYLTSTIDLTYYKFGFNETVYNEINRYDLSVSYLMYTQLNNVMFSSIDIDFLISSVLFDTFLLGAGCQFSYLMIERMDDYMVNPIGFGLQMFIESHITRYISVGFSIQSTSFSLASQNSASNLSFQTVQLYTRIYLDNSE